MIIYPEMNDIKYIYTQQIYLLIPGFFFYYSIKYNIINIIAVQEMFLHSFHCILIPPYGKEAYHAIS